MTIYYQDDQTTVYHGDCIEVIRNMPESSVDSIVTDPPYGLGFMGAKWDALPPGKDWAEECLRVLKPGGHLLAFGGTRTWHRLAVAIEDAGLEIRDSVMWLYGSGFPKSHDVSKAIDKRPGVAHHAEFGNALREAMTAAGYTNTFDVAEKVIGRRTGAVANWIKYQFPESKWWPGLRDLLGMDEAKWGPIIAEANREVTGRHLSGLATGSSGLGGHGEGKERRDIPATEAAKQWEGWGTALKPANEPIVMARKPFKGTVAANVLEHGTGAINVDACRIGTSGGTKAVNFGEDSGGMYGNGRGKPTNDIETLASGRWPANVILDEHMAGVLDEQSGPLHTQNPATRYRASDPAWSPSGTPRGTHREAKQATGGDEEKGLGASKFFYVAKAPKRERPEVNGVKHTTVKPLTLMRYLVRMVTPPGGTVLDPFAGSGTTIEAALIEGFNPIGIELTDEYLPLIQQRIQRQGVGR